MQLTDLSQHGRVQQFDAPGLPSLSYFHDDLSSSSLPAALLHHFCVPSSPSGRDGKRVQVKLNNGNLESTSGRPSVYTCRLHHVRTPSPIFQFGVAFAQRPIPKSRAVDTPCI